MSKLMSILAAGYIIFSYHNTLIEYFCKNTKKHRTTILIPLFDNEKKHQIINVTPNTPETMHRSFIFLAEGFEEVEALTVVDVMRRAGMDIKTVSIGDSHEVVGSHGIPVRADLLFKEADFDGSEWLICPGGMPGSSNLASFRALCDLLEVHKGKIAAICAAPAVVLAPLGLLKGKEATCYPGFEDECVEHGAVMRDVPVMALEKLITANGPSAALRFALAIVANSLGEAASRQVGEGMLYYPKTMNYYF